MAEELGRRVACSLHYQHLRNLRLLQAAQAKLIGLLQHPANPGEPFSVFRTGLDHLEIEVAGRQELEQWQERLTALGIPHSGIKDHLITLRDPDNIQLEFFWQKPSV